MVGAESRTPRAHRRRAWSSSSTRRTSTRSGSRSTSRCWPTSPATASTTRGRGSALMSFETTVLRRLAGRTRLPIIQLLDVGHRRPADLAAVGDPTTYGDLVTPEGLARIDEYADGIGAAQGAGAAAGRRTAPSASRPPWSATPTGAWLTVHVWTRAGREPLPADEPAPRRRGRPRRARRHGRRGPGPRSTRGWTATASRRPTASMRQLPRGALSGQGLTHVRSRPPPATAGQHHREQSGHAGREPGERHQPAQVVRVDGVRAKSAQIAVRPRKATPITRCPTLTGCRPLASRSGSAGRAGSWARRRCRRSCVMSSS